MIKWLKLEDIKAYMIASELSDYVWKIVSAWDWFNKRTLGSQWVDATDSISGNIAEGFGRYHKKDKQKFYYNGRALINEKEKDHILEELRTLLREINFLIKITGEKLEK